MRVNQEPEQLTLDQYQYAAGDTAMYPGKRSAQGLIYTILGLAGEGGEVANTLKKLMRDDGGVLTDARRQKLAGEIGDALWYCAMAAEELGIPLSKIANDNLQKLASRKERGKITGDGGER